jgi:hypothetical protein
LAPSGLFIELPSDGPKPLFPSCLVLFGLDTRSLLTRWGLSRGLLSCNLLSRSFLALGLLSRGLFIELSSDGPKPLFPSGLVLFGLDTCSLLARWGLSRGFPALGLLSCGLDTGRLLPLRLQLGGCLSRGFPTFGLLSRGLDTSRLLPPRLQLGGCLSRGFDLVDGLQVGDGQFNDLSQRRVGGPFGARERSRSVRTGRGVLR